MTLPNVFPNLYSFYETVRTNMRGRSEAYLSFIAGGLLADFAKQSRQTHCWKGTTEEIKKYRHRRGLGFGAERGLSVVLQLKGSGGWEHASGRGLCEDGRLNAAGDSGSGPRRCATQAWGPIRSIRAISQTMEILGCNTFTGR